ncbi:MAG: squalene--hopene cyclase [Verrucomicrobia bacterium]|nr:squalene--hopene cyclase [Verrucomicrobiota bacterium]
MAKRPTNCGELQTAIAQARDHLLSLQAREGYWVGELVVDATLCADYVTFLHWAQAVDLELEAKCVRHILDAQLPDGGWNIYAEGPSELNATVKAYFALKLAGLGAEDPRMARARAKALELGGVEKTNTYARLYFALLGQVSWDAVPAIPCEFLLLPRWLPVHLHAVSAWTRAMIVPLAIINHFRPTRELPPERGIQELYCQPGTLPTFEANGLRCLFLGIDRLLKVVERNQWLPFRQMALRRAEEWMLERIGDGCSGLAAIFPAMLNAMIALRTLGYPADHPTYQKAEADFRELFVEDERGFRIQPCFSPVWDTAIATLALARSGLPLTAEPLERATRWLVRQEVRIAGDWTVRNPGPEPSGWCFEFNNPFYPDTDDTAMVLIALKAAGYEDDPALYERALNWLLSFQCKDGGWAAFDKDVTNPLLENVPFADHNAILDPSCCDLTARTLEAMAAFGYTTAHPVVRKALRFLRQHQEADGAWYGRWGVNFIYGTWQVLRGLGAIGVDMSEPWVLRGRQWLETHQNPDGGWGESCASYEDPAARGRGRSTPSQTAWALMGLLSCPDVARESVERGIGYLLRMQNADGSWDEELITGTGFPRVFYLKYDLYRNSWPLLALAMYANRQSAPAPAGGRLRRLERPVEPSTVPALASLLAGLPGMETLRELLAKFS